MATPTDKSPALEDILERVYGRTTSIRDNCCVADPVGCGQPVDFAKMDDVDRREFRISGLCSDCQRLIFG